MARAFGGGYSKRGVPSRDIYSKSVGVSCAYEGLRDGEAARRRDSHCAGVVIQKFFGRGVRSAAASQWPGEGREGGVIDGRG